jgi:signal transduction histidine kinase
VLLTEVDTRQLCKLASNILESALFPCFVKINLLRSNIEGDINDTERLLVFLNDERSRCKDNQRAVLWPKELSEKEVSIVLRLGRATQPLGTLLLGEKQNGKFYTKREIAFLETAAKTIGLALENAEKYATINEFNSTLKREISNATRELRQTNRELDDIISIASHQLRSPAMTIHETLDALNEPSISLLQHKELVQIGMSSSDRMAAVIGSMLDISILRTRRLTLQWSNINLVHLAQETISQLDHSKESLISFSTTTETMIAAVDQAKLQEAMLNYIENALKYGSGPIKILLKQTRKRVYFEVHDSGIGVPRYERKRLFSKHYRASNVQTKDGFGIGLYAVKNIIEEHAGSVYYKPLESGSLFGFWIPLTKRRAYVTF